MGALLHHQSPFQDILQTEFHWAVEEHPSCSVSVEDRYASPGIIPQISHRHLQILRWSDQLSRGGIRTGSSPVPCGCPSQAHTDLDPPKLGRREPHHCLAHVSPQVHPQQRTHPYVPHPHPPRQIPYPPLRPSTSTLPSPRHPLHTSHKRDPKRRPLKLRRRPCSRRVLVRETPHLLDTRKG